VQQLQSAMCQPRLSGHAANDLKESAASRQAAGLASRPRPGSMMFNNEVG
jgi:hypothetical protein